MIKVDTASPNLPKPVQFVPAVEMFDNSVNFVKDIYEWTTGWDIKSDADIGTIDIRLNFPLYEDPISKVVDLQYEFLPKEEKKRFIDIVNQLALDYLPVKEIENRMTGLPMIPKHIKMIKSIIQEKEHQIINAGVGRPVLEELKFRLGFL